MDRTNAAGGRMPGAADGPDGLLAQCVVAYGAKNAKSTPNCRQIHAPKGLDRALTRKVRQAARAEGPMQYQPGAKPQVRLAQRPRAASPTGRTVPSSQRRDSPWISVRLWQIARTSGYARSSKLGLPCAAPWFRSNRSSASARPSSHGSGSRCRPTRYRLRRAQSGA